MSYSIIRNSKCKSGALNGMSRHNERNNEKYGNKDIDKNKTENNYHLKEPQGSYEIEFNRLKTENNLKGNLRLTGKKQSNVVCEFLITSDEKFFKSIGESETKRYFQSAYEFACLKCNEKNIISSVVHMDEKTPHMHLTYIPVVEGVNKKGETIEKINCSDFWKGYNSYGILQDDFNKFMNEKGFELDRGESLEIKKEHLSVKEFKISTKKEEIKKEIYNLSQDEKHLNKKKLELVNEKNLLDKKIDSIKNSFNSFQDTERKLMDISSIKTSKSILGSKITLLNDDYDNLFAYAKAGIELDGLKEKYINLNKKYNELKKKSDFSIKSNIKNIDSLNKINKLEKDNKKLLDKVNELASFIKKKELGDEYLKESKKIKIIDSKGIDR